MRKKITKEEMNDFLEEIGGLIYFYNGNKITNIKSFDVGEGWYPLLKKLISDLIKSGWNREILDIKEKFGGLRFYIYSGTEKIFKLIEKAEEKSYKICEITGNPGKIRTDLIWIKTLSDDEYLKIINETLN